MDVVTDARSTLSRIELRAAARLLNLGCGQRFHPAWTNVDLVPVESSIRRGDVTKPLPFDDEAFDAVYHSHLLEHLPRDRALPFLRECQRVLRPGGILRMAIPNLEAIVRLYLHALEDAWLGDAEALAQHQWLVMEMYDQATRESPGGAMLQYLQTEAIELAWYRLGVDGTVLRSSTPLPLYSGREGPPKLSPLPLYSGEEGRGVRGTNWRDRLRGWLFGSWRERLARWLLGDEYNLLRIGRFRREGEVHHWMYDRVSLRALLREAGFIHVRCVGPMDSRITHWADYNLDITPEGDVCKPDSLFVEAQKP